MSKKRRAYSFASSGFTDFAKYFVCISTIAICFLVFVKENLIDVKTGLRNSPVFTVLPENLLQDLTEGCIGAVKIGRNGGNDDPAFVVPHVNA